jgi:hypothetical protein
MTITPALAQLVIADLRPGAIIVIEGDRYVSHSLGSVTYAQDDDTGELSQARGYSITASRWIDLLREPWSLVTLHGGLAQHV